MNNTERAKLSRQLHETRTVPAWVIAVGEVLWDVFPDSVRLGGAPLNFAVHASRLGRRALILSAVGADSLGVDARAQIRALGLAETFVQTLSSLPTGTATVELDAAGQPRFTIQRPAAYDGLSLSNQEIQGLLEHKPEWIYYGTLFSLTPAAKCTLERLLTALPGARRFYDLNLRIGCYTDGLVEQLLTEADVIKLNEEELQSVGRMLDMPVDNIEAFCRAGSDRYRWEAVAVSLGAHGCAVWVRGAYAEADGIPIQVADTVGAGDAFSAAFLHGYSLGWDPLRIAKFANCVGATVASRPGAIPEWSLSDALALAT